MNENEQVIENAPFTHRGRRPIKDGRCFDELSTAEQIERWERVRYVLRKMTKHQIEKHFDMSTWLTKTSCGTVGCAAGQCAIDPWFNRRGFGVEWRAYDRGFNWRMPPEDFFGVHGYKTIFTNSAFMHFHRGGDGAGVDRKPRHQHRLVLRAVNQYLKQLKDEL